MRNLRVTALFGPGTWKAAGRRTRTTWQRCLKDSPTTTAGYVIENCFFASATRPSVAKIGTVVVPTFEFATAHPCANMFRLDVLV